MVAVRPLLAVSIAGGALPNRRPTPAADGRLPAQEPERLLVKVAAANDESASAFFKAAVAVGWETATAARTGVTADEAGTRLRYYLDRRLRPPQPNTPHAGASTIQVRLVGRPWGTAACPSRRAEALT